MSNTNESRPPIAYHITKLEKSDFDEWARLFRAYVDFYESALPDAQYQKTFDRIMDPTKELQALVLRDSNDSNKLSGLAHFFPHQTPWSEKMIMHFNDLYIDNELRGHGYGKQMIDAVAVAAKENGCFRLEWATKHGNPARKLYDKLAACDFVEYRMKLGDM